MAMSMNIRDYVKIYDNILDKKFCVNLVKKLKKQDWRTHEFYDSLKKTNISYDTDLSVSHATELLETQEINEKLWSAIGRYVSEDHKHMNNWFSGWNGYLHIRYNSYNKKTEMREHCDHIHSMFDGERKGIPVLSILGSLNEDYEGGELIMWQDQKIELKTGQLMIFPSNFLYPHKITPVTKGIRFSYVSWSW